MKILHTFIKKCKNSVGVEVHTIQSRIKLDNQKRFIVASTTRYSNSPDMYVVAITFNFHTLTLSVPIHLPPKEAHTRLLNYILKWHREHIHITEGRIFGDVSYTLT